MTRWTTLRITDVDGAGAGALLAYNAERPSERFLTDGWLLLSDMGRVLLGITADTTAGGQETLTGGTYSPVNRWGRFRYW